MCEIESNNSSNFLPLPYGLLGPSYSAPHGNELLMTPLASFCQALRSLPPGRHSACDLVSTSLCSPQRKRLTLALKITLPPNSLTQSSSITSWPLFEPLPWSKLIVSSSGTFFSFADEDYISTSSYCCFSAAAWVKLPYASVFT